MSLHRFPLFLRSLLPLSAALLAAGCASLGRDLPTAPPTPVINTALAQVEREHVDVARAPRARSRPYLRFDDFMRARLDMLATHGTRDEVAALLREAHALGDDIARQGILRTHATDREQLVVAARAESQAALERDLAHVATLDVAAVQSFARALAADIETPVRDRGRAGRVMRNAFLAPGDLAWLAWHIPHEYRGPNDVDFEQVRVLEPPQAPAVALGERLTRFAPVIVQQVAQEPAYDPRDDQIGAVALDAAGNVVIDTAQPTVYAYETRALINDVEHDQLVYTWWYPEHPPSKPRDPEAGKIEGVTMRITLDLQGQPVIYETVYNCGCYHRVFVTERVEQAAQAEYGDPLRDKHFAIEKTVKRRIDLVIPELLPSAEPDLVASAGAPGDHVAAFCYAGFHLLGAVRPYDPAVSERAVAPVGRYALEPYEGLELIATEQGWGSMFEDNGLVHGAERREGFLLGGLGLLEAGQPRQRGTQKIHFDQYAFDDPRLLDTFLRLPSNL